MGINLSRWHGNETQNKNEFSHLRCHKYLMQLKTSESNRRRYISENSTPNLRPFIWDFQKMGIKMIFQEKLLFLEEILNLIIITRIFRGGKPGKTLKDKNKTQVTFWKWLRLQSGLITEENYVNSSRSSLGGYLETLKDCKFSKLYALRHSTTSFIGNFNPKTPISTNLWSFIDNSPFLLISEAFGMSTRLQK